MSFRTPLALSLVAWVLCFPLAASADDIVPNVLGLTAAEAKKALENEKYKMKDGGGILSTFKIDTVAKQDPAGGTKVKKEGEVLVHFSKGIWVRDYKNIDIASALIELKAVGIEPVLVPDDAPGIAKGIIVDQVPPASKLFDATADKLKLHVATGPTIAVPDLKGKPIAVAQNLAKASKLIVSVAPGNPDRDGFTSPGQSSPGKCVISPITVKVVTMTPPAGTLVFASSVITVTTTKEIGKPFPPEPCKCNKNGCILL